MPSLRHDLLEQAPAWQNQDASDMHQPRLGRRREVNLENFTIAISGKENHKASAGKLVPGYDEASTRAKTEIETVLEEV